MAGKVLLTEDISVEVSRAIELSSSATRKFYVYSRACTDVDRLKALLPSFTFIPLECTLNPEHTTVVIDNTPEDFFILKYIRLSDIMDKNVSMHQSLKGFKLVVDRHPFMEKSEPYWCYFPWSFVSRSLLGYPHCYAARTAEGNGTLLDCISLATKVAPMTETTLRAPFEDDITTEKLSVDQDTFNAYQTEKLLLFEKGVTQRTATRQLKKLIDDRLPALREGFNTVNLGKVYGQYCNGVRRLIVSDMKVDAVLEAEFWAYIRNLNQFMETLWNLSKI